MQTTIAPMKIGPVIREIREALKATLEEIAFAAETNASNLSRIERGTQGYSSETLARIAHALGVTVSELHRRAEAAPQRTGKSSRSNAAQKPVATDPEMTSSKFSALTPDHRELVEDFMTLLLRRQRQRIKKPEAVED
ncbi:helix-turn-helix transcriptional regulator [Roseateles sp.]|uniref:helix-turn-helix domain-containing protein n=1 Tax=Roseateles sp. TaxID=1971397 RepID=UPI00286C76B5|nr:helix-turn-helix transcriptional regulator [Roseateles sp.]